MGESGGSCQRTCLSPRRGCTAMSPGFADHCAQHRGRTQTPCQGEGGGVESRLPVHSRRPEPVFRRLFDFNEESSSHERFFASSLMLMNSLLVTALFEAEVIPFSTSSRTPRQRSPPDPLTSSERSSTWPRSRPRPMVPLRPVRIVRWNPGHPLQMARRAAGGHWLGGPSRGRPADANDQSSHRTDQRSDHDQPPPPRSDIVVYLTLHYLQKTAN